MAQQNAKSVVSAIACSLIGLVIVVSVVGYFSIPQVATEKTELLAKLDLALNNQKAAYHELFGSTPIVGGNYSFSPPIPIYRAVIVGLESDGWTAASLKNMSVYVSLYHDVFYTNVTALYQIAAKENLTLADHPNPDSTGPCFGSESINEVTAPVSDYQPQFFNGVTIRYVWTISIEPTSGGGDIPPPGYYVIDAATAQLVPMPLLF